MRTWTVADVMTTDVATVRENTDYRSIVDALAQRGVGAVPVVDEQRHVVGIVSEADLLHKIEFAGEPARRRIFPSRHHADRDKGEGRVATDFMSAPAVTTGPQTPVTGAARLMADKHIKRLPVVDDDGRLLGIVSRADLLRQHLRSDEQLRRDIVEDVLGRTLWIHPDAVTVTVDAGVATLRGRLERKSLAELTVRLTSAVPGVVAVQDQLTFEMDDSELASSRWQRSHPFSATWQSGSTLG